MSGVQVKRKHYLFEAESMGADATSEAQENYQVADMTIYVWWKNGSTPVGQMILQANVAPEKQTPEWKDLTLDTTASVSGNEGNLEITTSAPLTSWRLKYARTSGDADLYATWEGRSRG